MFLPELIEVAVIAADVAHRERERLVNRGAAEGLAPQDLILPVSAGQALIDQGSDVHLQSDQPALLGRCVLGWIDQVGRHTSTIRPITDEKFRGRAQLVRQTTQGPRLGAEGVLAGHGQQLCRLTFVAATEAVSVGDEVFTSSRGEVFPVVMYYGRVTSAELQPGEPYWDIMVMPGATLSDAHLTDPAHRSESTASGLVGGGGRTPMIAGLLWGMVAYTAFVLEAAAGTWSVSPALVPPFLPLLIVTSLMWTSRGKAYAGAAAVGLLWDALGEAPLGSHVLLVVSTALLWSRLIGAKSQRSLFVSSLVVMSYCGVVGLIHRRLCGTVSVADVTLEAGRAASAMLMFIGLALLVSGARLLASWLPAGQGSPRASQLRWLD